MNIKQFFTAFPPKNESNFILKPAPTQEKKQKNQSVSSLLFENRDYLDRVLHRDCCYDVTLREFDVRLGRKNVQACLYFIDGLVDSASVNDSILRPLMIESEKLKARGVEAVCDVLLSENQVTKSDDMQEIVDALCYGSAALFIDGYSTGILAQVIGWDRRAISEPENEPAIFGPHQALTENMKSNTSVIRKMIRSEHLMVETQTVGEEGKTFVAIMYMENITNPSLVEEVKRRIGNLSVDYIMTSNELEQFIEDKSHLSVPQIISTERPDRCVHAIMSGRVVVILDNSPMALIMPTTVFDLLESAEDIYLRPSYSLLVKTMRLLGVFLSIYLPGIYIAAISYHTTILPTGMLTTIMKASRQVPFHSVTELIFMVIAFEIVREASSRVPGFMGASLGIIGPLVLGQAAISANIVSPVMMIVFSIATIGSFATPNVSMGFAGRILNIVYIILGSMAGFLGLATGIFIQIMLWQSTRSFGVPMMSPFMPEGHSVPEAVRSDPIWKKEDRPAFLYTLRPKEQRHISRRWMRRH